MVMILVTLLNRWQSTLILVVGEVEPALGSKELIFTVNFFFRMCFHDYCTVMQNKAGKSPVSF